MTDFKKTRVNLHSKLTVVSSNPTEQGKTHNFTALDHVMGQHTIHFLFYYRVNPFKEGPFESDLDNIRVNLSDVLSLYPVVTGRLARREGDGNWEVKYNDAGIRTFRASVGTTIDEWLRSADAFEERDLTAWDDMPEDPSIWSPFRFQFNDFEGGGLAIGFSYTHLHADFSSAIQLLKSWAEVQRGEPIQNLPVFDHHTLNDRVSSKTNTESTNYFAKKENISYSATTKLTTATFKFSDSTMKKNLSNITNKCPNATPFEFLLALFWMKILQAKREQNQPHTISVCTDLRSSAKSTVPQGYFGNAVHFSSLSLDANALESDDTFGLANVASVVHNGMANSKNEECFLDWVESRKDESGKYGHPFQMYGPELTCVRMDDMMNGTGESEPLMYDVSFKKDEKPMHVSCHVGNVKGEGVILVMPSPEGGLSRTVTVTLPEEEMDRLCEDRILLDMKPIMIISGRNA